MQEPAPIKLTQPRGTTLINMAVAALIIAALYFGREIFVPVALSVLLSFVLAPFVMRLHLWRVPRTASVLVVVFIGFSIIFSLGGLMVSQATRLAGALPGTALHYAVKANPDATLLAALASAGCRFDVASPAEDRARRGTLMRLGQIAGRDRVGGSSWQSLERATGDIETDYLNGEITLLGRTHSIPVPANALLQELGRRAAAQRQAPGTVSVASILEQLDGKIVNPDSPED